MCQGFKVNTNKGQIRAKHSSEKEDDLIENLEFKRGREVNRWQTNIEDN